MRSVLLVPVLAAVLTAPAFPALAQTAPAADTAAAAPTLPAITVAPAERRALRDRVIASGLVAPVENVQVAPLIEGQPIALTAQSICVHGDTAGAVGMAQAIRARLETAGATIAPFVKP